MIGAIADDFTGGTDVAVAFRRTGLLTSICFGMPDAQTRIAPDAEAVVVSLKTRTVPAAHAVEQSTAAARWLQERGAEQLYFKYCSTFDSTPAGNIGPVADTLVDLTDAPFTVVVPSSPEHGRTQYLGHLFVGDVLLSDSPLRDHPLTPMTDSRVAQVLSTQTRRPVALVAHPVVARGIEAIRAALHEAHRQGATYVVVDALDEGDLTAIGAACAELPLLTGAAGLAGGWGRGRGASTPRNAAHVSDLRRTTRAVALAGSCSARTLEQIATMRAAEPSLHLDALTTPDSQDLAVTALDWFDAQDPARSPLIYTSQPPAELREVQRRLGTERASQVLEGALASIARGLVTRGVRRIVVAGGETSGAVVSALGVRSGTIGCEEAPGVPWIHTTTTDGDPLALLLKSGNFGDRSLLERAATTSGESA